MTYASDRLLMYDKDGRALGDLSPDALLSIPRMVEEINGEHSLTIETTKSIPQGTRLLWRDGMGAWHEWVVAEPEEGHRHYTYYCIWSMQEDLTMCSGTTHWAASSEGTHEPISARQALELALSDQSRWQVGTVDVQTMAGASMYDRQVWQHVTLVRDVWEGELSASIEMGPDGVISRKVNLLAHVGQETATRRFDWGEDVSDISRTPPPSPLWCRIRPRGGSAKTDADGVDYSDRIGIEGVTPNGEDYIEDADAALAYRVTNPDGTYEYPMETVVYDLDTEGDDEELYNKALEDLHNHTRRVPTYRANVLQYARAGLDYRGVAVGDAIQIVDRGFNEDVALRLEGRALRIEQDLPLTGDNPDNTELTVGELSPSLSQTIRDTVSTVTSVLASHIAEVQGGGAIVYLNELIDRLNGEINATGGYYYLIPGIGIRTYDAAVSDPLEGDEAGKVIELRGGSLRIADSRTAGGDWDWKTVIVSGHIAAELVTVANLTAGFIGNPNGSYWDLDNNILHIGGRTETEINEGIDATITGSVTEYIQTTSPTTAPSQDAQDWSTTHPTWESGKYIWQRATITHGDGTVTHSEPVCVSGRDGQDGTSVTVTAIEYGTSSSASEQPSSYSSTVPTNLAQGTWLWVRTTYSDSSTATTKSYVGTDGQDGTSVYVVEARKVGGTTTVELSSGDTLTIEDGQDGADGLAGSSGYVHVAWATSADGSTGFSTTVSSGKTYLGVYTDNTATDSQTPSDYSWSLIKGADGADGLNQATVLLYKRGGEYRVIGEVTLAREIDGLSVSGDTMTMAFDVSGDVATSPDPTPAPPSTSTTYTFATGVLSGTLDGWSQTIPDGSGTLWVTSATAISADATDSIAASEWATAARMAEDGASTLVAIVEYAIGAPGSTAPLTGWSTTVPEMEQGTWLWTRVSYSDGTTSTTPSYVGTDGQDGVGVVVQEVTKTGGVTTVTLAGTDGTVTTLTIADGEDGDNGTPGASGYTHIAWATSADGSTGFSTSVSSGKTYIGVYADHTAADSQNPSAYNWSLIKGADGTSVTVTAIEYGTSSSGSATPSSWSQTAPATVAQGTWLWVRTTYSDSSTATTKSYVGTDGEDGTSVYITDVTKVGNTTTVIFSDGESMTIEDGADGTNGTPGANGYVHTAWATSADGTQGFSTSVSANKTYLGVYTDNTAADSQAPSAYSWSLIKGADGADGADGLNAATVHLYKRAGDYRVIGEGTLAREIDGLSVSGDTMTMAFDVSGEIAASPDPTPAPPSTSTTYTFATGVLSGTLDGWSQDVPDGSGTLWVTTASAIANDATDSIASSEWATVARMAEDGASTLVAIVEYAIGGEGPEPPLSGWSESVPTTSPGTWLWTRVTYSDGTVTCSPTYMGTDGMDGVGVVVQDVTKADGVTTVTLAGTDGTVTTLTIADGEDGDDGTPGASGYTHIAWATAADGSTGFSTSVSAGKTYIGVYADHSSADSQTPSDYNWSLIKGADGAPGSDAYAYSIAATPAALVRAEDGTLTPTSITFAATRAKGTDSPTAYAGRLVISEHNGGSWSTKYTSSSNESSKSYSPTSTARLVRCDLYLAGGTTTLLDTQTSPVVSDGATGAEGADGLNQATVHLYKRAGDYRIIGEGATAREIDGLSVSGEIMTMAFDVSGEIAVSPDPTPAPPSASTTYTFATGVLTGTLGGWSQTIPDGNGTLWVTSAAAISDGDTDSIAASEWATVARMAEDGAYTLVVSVEYAIGGEGPEPPLSGWSESVPTTVPGTWMWTRVTYSDGTVACSPTYMGTDGMDGVGVVVQDVTKTGGVTTVTLAGTDGTVTTLTIADGEDGTNGTPGASGYTHIAWATSADGSTGFSTSVSSGKTYIGVYADHTAADSQNPSAYNWSLIKGADGTNGADGYTVMLTNESHTFAGSTGAAIASSTTTQVIAYKGATQMAATIGTVTGAPDGMSTSVSSNGTSSATLTVSVTTALTTRQGTLTVPVTVDGKAFSLKFSWSLALTGATGATGANGTNGADGKNTATIYLYTRLDVASVTEESARFTFDASGDTVTYAGEYADETSIPTYVPDGPGAATTYTFATGALSGDVSPWSQTIPDEDGTIWVTTATVASSAATVSVPAATWTEPRALSVGIYSVSTEYYLSTSDTTPMGGSWQDAPADYVRGRYYWTRDRVVWEDGTESRSEAVYDAALSDAISTAHHADDGAWAQVTDVSVSVEFCLNDSSTSEPETLDPGWSETAVVPASGEHLWKRDRLAVHYGARTAYSVVNVQHVTGYVSGLTAVTAQYYLSTSETATAGGSWATTRQTWVTGRCYWTRARKTSGSSHTYTTGAPCAVGTESSAMEVSHGASERLYEIETGWTVSETRIMFAVENAARTATDYLTYGNGELVLGTTDSAVRNVMTNSRNAFRTSAGDIAYFGLDTDGLYRMFIENARITDMLRFGDFAWIARQNGNMTLKWVG